MEGVRLHSQEALQAEIVEIWGRHSVEGQMVRRGAEPSGQCWKEDGEERKEVVVVDYSLQLGWNPRVLSIGEGRDELYSVILGSA